MTNRMWSVAIASAVLFGWAVPAPADEAEDKAVAFVKRLGGGIRRDEKQPGKPVVTVYLQNSRVMDADLPALTVFGDVTEIDLRRTAVTDIGMKHLSQLKKLTTLNLQDTKVSDDGIKFLMPLKKLSSLDLTRTRVTDAGVKHLVQFTGMTGLYLWGTDVTDAGVKELVSLKELKELELGNPKVTDAGVKRLATLGSLVHLTLSNTSVTDTGLKQIATLRKLKRLRLDRTKITDAGLQQLAALPELRLLMVIGTNVTKDGVAALKRKMPNCAIEKEEVQKCGGCQCVCSPGDSERGCYNRAMSDIMRVLGASTCPRSNSRKRAARTIRIVFLEHFGDIRQPVIFEPSWRTGPVVGLAASIYVDRAFDLMPVLGDALEDAGCSDADILSHCRGAGKHAR